MIINFYKLFLIIIFYEIFFIITNILIMDKRYDEINYYIYDKIQKYNSRFSEFKKTLDSQDKIVKKTCAKSVKKNIKNDPKKYAQKLVDLTNKNEESTEESESETNNEKKMLGGDVENYDDDDVNDYDDSVKITEIITEEENIENNSYNNLVIGVTIAFCLYLMAFIILGYMDQDYYDMTIFKPIRFFLQFIKKKTR